MVYRPPQTVRKHRPDGKFCILALIRGKQATSNILYTNLEPALKMVLKTGCVGEKGSERFLKGKRRWHYLSRFQVTKEKEKQKSLLFSLREVCCIVPPTGKFIKRSDQKSFQY